jgi:hypothetical protein
LKQAAIPSRIKQERQIGNGVCPRKIKVNNEIAIFKSTKLEEIDKQNGH